MNHHEADRGAVGWGAFFCALGLTFLLKSLDLWDIGADVIWPVLLIGFGSAIIAQGVEVYRARGPFE